MADALIEALAKVIVDYSLDLQAGQTFKISGSVVATPLIREVYRLAARKGAYPFLRLTLPELLPILLNEAPEESLDWVSPITSFEIDHTDAELTIWADANTQEMAGVDPARIARVSKAQFELSQRRMQHMFSEPIKTHWCGTLFPVYAQAQDARMSLEDYENFVYHAMMLDVPDPVGAWRELSARQQHYCDVLSQHDEIRVVAPDTDIRVKTRGRRWINADGHLNFPDGEVFTGPLEDSANGTIRYTFPTNYRGREAEDVQLWFEDGVVVKWEARRGKELLDEMFAMDEGARRLGEFAIGTNYAVPTFTKNILFDEKIGGTCHLAVGASIPMSGGKVQSSLHWDMICDLRKGGAIYADGDLIQENGVWTI